MGQVETGIVKQLNGCATMAKLAKYFALAAMQSNPLPSLLTSNTITSCTLGVN